MAKYRSAQLVTLPVKAEATSGSTSKGEETLNVLLTGAVEGKLMSCVFATWDDKALKIVSRTSPCWHDSDVSVLSPIPTAHLDQK